MVINGIIGMISSNPKTDVSLYKYLYILNERQDNVNLKKFHLKYLYLGYLINFYNY